MRVLLDENLPHDLASLLTGHEVTTVQSRGWAGVTNGDLLRLAAGNIDAFLTMDRNLEHQQTFTSLSFGIGLLRAKSNRIQDLQPLVGDILLALGKLEAGHLVRIGA